MKDLLLNNESKQALWDQVLAGSSAANRPHPHTTVNPAALEVIGIEYIFLLSHCEYTELIELFEHF